jgi:hypothetical protein
MNKFELPIHECFEMSVQRTELQHVVVVADAKVDHVYLHKLEGQRIEHGIFQELLYRLKAVVLGMDQPPITVEMAEDGWEAFKERFFPRWYIKKWPVRKQKLVIDIKVLYPFMKIPYTDSPFTIVLKKRDLV